MYRLRLDDDLLLKICGQGWMSHGECGVCGFRDLALSQKARKDWPPLYCPPKGGPSALDSGLCSRVYAFRMETQPIQIGELARRTSLSVDAIRFYERRDLLPKAARSTGGFRLYSTDDLERVLFIRQIH